MYEALNIKKKLHSLSLVCETNFLSLVSLQLNNNYQIQTKCYSIKLHKLLTSKQALILINHRCSHRPRKAPHCHIQQNCRCPILLNLSVEFISYFIMFFSHNKLANNIFSHNFLAKLTKPSIQQQLIDGIFDRMLK